MGGGGETIFWLVTDKHSENITVGGLGKHVPDTLKHDFDERESFYF